MTPGPGEPVVQRTSRWLTTQHDAGLAAFGADDLVYEDGGAPRRLTKEHFEYLVRTLKILRWLDRLSFESFIDLGSGSGFLPALVRERYGVDSYYADLVHRLNLPGSGERFGRLHHAPPHPPPLPGRRLRRRGLVRGARASRAPGRGASRDGARRSSRDRADEPRGARTRSAAPHALPPRGRRAPPARGAELLPHRR